MTTEQKPLNDKELAFKTKFEEAAELLLVPPKTTGEALDHMAITAAVMEQFVVRLIKKENVLELYASLANRLIENWDKVKELGSGENGKSDI